MKFKLNLIFIINILSNVNCIVYLRNKNDRGPKAWLSGVQCLSKISNLYFYDVLPTRTKNCVLMHTHDLSTPAYEIEYLYLKKLHERLMYTKENQL